ncbi:MAG: hypothetical protein ACU843_05610 [Gammaproteobacteria bacterium]
MTETAGKVPVILKPKPAEFNERVPQRLSVLKIFLAKTAKILAWTGLHTAR